MRTPYHKLKMGEIAARISKHLGRMERDPGINRRIGDSGAPLFWQAWSGYSSGPKLWVRYVPHQLSSLLSKKEALAYLRWLDAGNNGRHYKQQQEEKNR